MKNWSNMPIQYIFLTCCIFAVKHTHNIPIFILSLFYFTQHNNTVHVVFFCTEAFCELVTNTGCIIPVSVKSSQGSHVAFFFAFFLILPFKKYQFHKRFIKVFICL